jgi:NitT/TauT family transport system ATP-binding protein
METTPAPAGVEGDRHDRAVILDSDPGRVKAELPIAPKHPRDRTAPVFRRLVERVYEIMTATAGEQRASGIGHRLPSAQVTQLLGVLDEVSHPTHGGHADLAALADSLSREIDRS